MAPAASDDDDESVREVARLVPPEWFAEVPPTPAVRARQEALPTPAASPSSYAAFAALVGGAAISLGVGVMHGMRSAPADGDGGDGRAGLQSGARQPSPMPLEEKFGVRRTVRALGYATALVGASGAAGVFALCSALDVWSAAEFGAAMHARLGGVREQLEGTLRPAREGLGAAFAAVTHLDFDALVLGLQARLGAAQPEPRPPGPAPERPAAGAAGAVVDGGGTRGGGAGGAT